MDGTALRALRKTADIRIAPLARAMEVSATRIIAIERTPQVGARVTARYLHGLNVLIEATRARHESTLRIIKTLQSQGVEPGA